MKTLTPTLVRDYRSAAMRAWSELGMLLQPDSIELLRHKGHSIVLRFQAEGRSVIAKRTKARMVSLEQTIYEKILDPLPIPTLHCYGSRPAEDPHHRWLFLEDAGDGRFSTKDPEHADLADRWLANMHRFAVDTDGVALLPDAGTTRYLQHLRRAQGCLQEVQPNPYLEPCDLNVLKKTAGLLFEIQHHWNQLERCCALLPKTLVHGDFIKKNLRIRHGESGPVLLPLDWETAGWGSPAVDLIGVRNLERYGSDSGFDITLSDLCRVAHCGKILRMVASIDWDARRLRYEWIERAMINMRIYSAQLEDSMRALEWDVLSGGGFA